MKLQISDPYGKNWESKLCRWKCYMLNFLLNEKKIQVNLRRSVPLRTLCRLVTVSRTRWLLKRTNSTGTLAFSVELLLAADCAVSSCALVLRCFWNWSNLCRWQLVDISLNIWWINVIQQYGWLSHFHLVPECLCQHPSVCCSLHCGTNSVCYTLSMLD